MDTGSTLGRGKGIMAAALLLLVIQAAVFIGQGQRFLRSEARQEDAGVQLLRCRELLADLQDAETGQRGYLLTGAETYLRPYQRATGHFDDRLLRTGQLLLRSHPDMDGPLRQLQALIEHKMVEMADTIRLRANGDGAAALRRMLDGDGRSDMEQIRAVLDTLMLQVRSERTALNQELSDHVRKAGWVLLSILLTVVLMAGLGMRELVAVARRNEELSRRLQFESTHDELTGLPNRRLLYMRLSQLTGAAPHAACAVLFLGLEGLKPINDELGREVGDEVLRQLAPRLAAAAPGALLVRLAGDEFALLLTLDVSRAALKLQTGRLLAVLATPLPQLAPMPPGALGASVGIALYPLHGKTPEHLIAAADIALQQARRSGSGRYRFAADLSDAPLDAGLPA
ncbi:diguanylate cyclase [Rugamonas sp.]|uniref:diguanylate cyclase domain-containing protein n=1 Tax=Rugamonas sp. TaxID=1926287 RepID=UPI0025F8731D|nr:diguanylate cyclase [Rugamonas sp.]